MFRGKDISIWRWDRGQYKIQVEDPIIYKRIKKWSFAREDGAVGVNYFMRQFLIPANKFKCACKMLDIEIPKHPGRVKAGQASIKKCRESLGHGEEKASMRDDN
jgi:hypothetical protein